MTSGYFQEMERALKQAGCHRPVLVIDRDRLDRNLARMKDGLGRLPLRIVDKSLPSLPLIGYVMRALATTRIMSFHLPITLAVLEAFPDADILYGKPMPAEAVEQAFAAAGESLRTALRDRVVWLIDSPERLAAYGAVASRLGITLAIAFEVDVGMHRGGFASPEALRAILPEARRMRQLDIRGLMGYEAHIPKIPGFAGGPASAHAAASARLRAFADCLAQSERRILNTGGSKTVLTYRGDPLVNDVSAGSALLMPSDFDTPDLAGFEPAAFIATPALKVGDAELPGPAVITRLFRQLGLIPRRNCHIYGGAWMAAPVHPPGLYESHFWGHSSNQQFLGMRPGTHLKPGDLVFLRPTQSEAVLQQFGPLMVFSGGRIVDRWAPLPTG